MFAPITRSMTLIFGLCSAALSPDLLAETDPETAPQSATQAVELAATSVSAEGLGINTENSNAYTTGAMSTATRMNLSIKETPQSVSVVTRQQMDDFKLGTLSEAMSQTTGIVVQHNDSDRVSYSARGYPINNFQIDGMLNTFGRMKSDSDTIIYDRIEVVRGATGLPLARAILRRRSTWCANVQPPGCKRWPVSAAAAMTITTATSMSAGRWRSMDACAGARCWPIATASRSATNTRCNARSATASSRPT